MINLSKICALSDCNSLWCLKDTMSGIIKNVRIMCTVLSEIGKLEMNFSDSHSSIVMCLCCEESHASLITFFGSSHCLSYLPLK